MSVWRCVALCTMLTMGTVKSECLQSQECELHQWVSWRCTDCCKQNASPNSAYQPRVICCPTKRLNLTECLHYCNRTLDQVERYGPCKDHCTCPNGFHFAATTTSTQQPKLSTTILQSTTTSHTILTRIRTSNYPNTIRHAQSTISLSSATTPLWTPSAKQTVQQNSITPNIVKFVKSTVNSNAATKPRLTPTAKYTLPKSSPKANTIKRVFPTQTSSPKPTPSIVILQTTTNSPNIKQTPTAQHTKPNKPVSLTVDSIQTLSNSTTHSTQSFLIQTFSTTTLDNSTSTSHISSSTKSLQPSLARPISAMTAGNSSKIPRQSSPTTPLQPTISTPISTSTLHKTPITVPGANKMSTKPTDTTKNTPELKETSSAMTDNPTTIMFSTKVHPFQADVSGKHVSSNNDVTTFSTTARQLTNNESSPGMHPQNNSNIGKAASDHGTCLEDPTNLIGFGRLTGVPFVVTLFTCGILIGALITTALYHILQRKAQRIGVQQGDLLTPKSASDKGRFTKSGMRPGNRFVDNLDF